MSDNKSPSALIPVPAVHAATPATIIPPTNDLDIKFAPLFGNNTQRSRALSLRVPNLQLHSVPTDYWRYFMSQVRCEIRLAFQAIAVRVQIILPTGQRQTLYFRYETKLSFIVSELLTKTNYAVKK